MGPFVSDLSIRATSLKRSRSAINSTDAFVIPMTVAFIAPSAINATMPESEPDCFKFNPLRCARRG